MIKQNIEQGDTNLNNLVVKYIVHHSSYTNKEQIEKLNTRLFNVFSSTFAEKKNINCEKAKSVSPQKKIREIHKKI